MSTIYVYTDGRSPHNPGPIGVGVVVVYEGEVGGHTFHVGHGTNMAAALWAGKYGLVAVPDQWRRMPVVIYSDMKAVVDIMNGRGMASANVELVNGMLQIATCFKQLRFKHLGSKAHSRFKRHAEELSQIGVNLRGK